MDIKICFAVYAVNGWSRQNRTVECMCIRHVCFPPSPCSNKQDACNNAIYWIRTNVSSIAASALTTKLNARMVDTNVTLLYASSNSTRSKWPNHYVRRSTWLSYHQQLLADGIWTHNPRLTRQNEYCYMDLKWVSERINLSTWQCHASSPRLYYAHTSAATKLHRHALLAIAERLKRLDLLIVFHEMVGVEGFEPPTKTL